MSIGDYVIANDLIGVICAESENTFTLKDADGNQRDVNKGVCREIVNSFALAASIYVKLRKRANSEKTES